MDNKVKNLHDVNTQLRFEFDEIDQNNIEMDRTIDDLSKKNNWLLSKF